MQRGSTNESSMHDFSTSALHYPVNAWNSSTDRINLHLLKSIGGYTHKERAEVAANLPENRRIIGRHRSTNNSPLQRTLSSTVSSFLRALNIFSSTFQISNSNFIATERKEFFTLEIFVNYNLYFMLFSSINIYVLDGAKKKLE